ncbi:hypothetical protein M422DRAFT_33289, partial [Sphaerobolus stellatus SS14]
VLHLCITHYLDGIRQGTAANKSRGEVRGSGRKIRPQKGTGRARLGDAQSPMLRGGGVAWAKKARDFSTKLPRKVIQMGWRVLLSARVKEEAFGVVESLRFSSRKNRKLEARLNQLGWQKTLFITGEEKIPESFEKGSQGMDIKPVRAQDLNIHEALRWPRLVLDLAAVEHYERTLGRPEVDALAGM